MVGWHHRLNGHEFEQAPGVGDGQGGSRAVVHGVSKSQTILSNWTELNLPQRHQLLSHHSVCLNIWNILNPVPASHHARDIVDATFNSEMNNVSLIHTHSPLLRFLFIQELVISLYVSIIFLSDCSWEQRCLYMHQYILSAPFMADTASLNGKMTYLSSFQSLSHVRLFETPWITSTPGLAVHHKLPEFTQTHVHWASDAIQPSQPLSSPSPPAPNPSQHQSLFQWVSSSLEMAKVLEFQL